MIRSLLVSLLLLSTLRAVAQNDTIPPTIACPPHDTVTLGAGECTFEYFYAIASGDNEPGDTLVQTGGLESGAGFPLGNTVNVFVAIDAAGNTASCSFQITVQNYAGPLVCRDNISVSLDSSCTWNPRASDLLEGNTGCPDSAYYQLQVDKVAPFGNGPWVPFPVGFDDLGKTYAFRVRDTLFGYSCFGNVKINDQFPPTLSCQDITISCAVDNVSPFFLRDSLGIAAAVALADDGCGQVTLTHLDATADSTCTSGLVGVINRRWTAKDLFGNTSTCIQHISLSRPTLADLHYPPDVTINCTDGDISPAKTGQPYIEFAGRRFTNLCQLGTASNDTIIYSCPGNGHLIRTWFVIDWCSAEALETGQIITIEDKTGPTFKNCLADLTISTGTTNCTVTVDMPDFLLADACSYSTGVQAFWQINNAADTLNGILSDFPGNDPAVSDTLVLFLDPVDFPVGIHAIRYVATDACGNTGECAFNLHVWDSLPPTASCPPASAIQLSGNTVEIDAAIFDNGSHDDCGVLAFRVKHQSPSPCASDTLFRDKITFCCFESGDTVGVLLRVYDVPVPDSVPSGYAAAQSADCLIKVAVEDPQSLCSPDPLTLSGTTKTETGLGVAGVNVKLELSTGPVFQAQTDDQGVFSFSNLLPPGSSYTLTPFKNNQHLDGVSTFDLVLMTKHILGLEALNSPYKIIAADANKSNSVTTFDVVEIRKLILGIYDSLPANTSWRFVDKAFVFPDPANPFQMAFPETITDSLPADFIAVKTGDVNGTAMGSGLTAPAERGGAPFFFDVDDREVAAGETVSVAFTGAEQALGYQFTLHTAGLQTLQILPGPGLNESNFAVFEDAVTVSVDNGTGVFSIRFRALEPGRLSDRLAVSSRITPAEAYRPDGQTDRSVALRFNSGVVTQPGFELFQNRPNPFRDGTVIDFYLPGAAEVTLKILDEAGRSVHTQSGYFPGGRKTIRLDEKQLPAPGIYYYQVSTNAGSAMGKMVRIGS